MGKPISVRAGGRESGRGTEPVRAGERESGRAKEGIFHLPISRFDDFPSFRSPDLPISRCPGFSGSVRDEGRGMRDEEPEEQG
jgi:hypothetical protein